MRLLFPGGGPAGAGVLVSLGGSRPLHVITCAHVLTDITGRRESDDDGTGARPGPGPLEVLVDIPGRGWAAKASLVQGSWVPTPRLDVSEPGHLNEDRGDFAALSLAVDAPPLPPGCLPLPLAPCGDPAGQPVLVLGYPNGLSDGIVTESRLVGTGGACPSWVQLEGRQVTGAALEGGFSGAAVWDPAKSRVVGLVTAAHTRPETKVAWMLPVEAAVGFWSPLGGALRSPPVRVCRPPSAQDQRELAGALLDIPQIDYDLGLGLRMSLPRAVRRSARDHPVPLQRVQALIEACLEQRDGCPTLREAVAGLGGDTVATQEALAVLDRLCCGAVVGRDGAGEAPSAAEAPGGGRGRYGSNGTFGGEARVTEKTRVPEEIRASEETRVTEESRAPASEWPAPQAGPALPKYLVDAVAAVDCLQDDATLRDLMVHFGVTLRTAGDRLTGKSLRLLVLQLMTELRQRPEGLALLVEYLEVLDGSTKAIKDLKVFVAALEVELFLDGQWNELFSLLESVRVPHLWRRYARFLRGLGHVGAPALCTEPWAVFLHAASLNSRPGESLPCFRVLRELLAAGAVGAEERSAILAWALANDPSPVPDPAPAEAEGRNQCAEEREAEEEEAEEEEAEEEKAAEEPEGEAGPPSVWRPDGYLIVRLQPLLDAAPGSDALLSHWWRVPNGEQLRGPDRRIDLRDAEYEVRRLLRHVEGAEDYPQSADLAVEFVLPRDWLGLGVERWRKDASQGVEGVLGEEHHVVLRSLERLNRRDVHVRWARRWSAFVDGRAGRVHWFPEDGRQHLLSDPPPAVVVLSAPPGGGRSTEGERGGLDELSEALRAGVPVVLWDRRGERDPAFRNALNQLLTEHDPRQLPGLVRALRTSPGMSDAEEYFSVGRHVALLWDDPDRMPVAHTGAVAVPPPTTGEERL
ncbi:serine protease [Streptomyces sp. NBC_00237]|uniref:VMAP-C domain-containing protein n=1 Tax=Streptomyces sp. NBC_00237 TaxID=2975687 RepID=UPI00224F41FB|nr:trypsin-like peptidase domain-containing protein [Streptomyces sp. NBC_00237]MCX5204505.1 serine protease [Streptomyces sp. NBC_00237]